MTDQSNMNTNTPIAGAVPADHPSTAIGVISAPQPIPQPQKPSPQLPSPDPSSSSSSSSHSPNISNASPSSAASSSSGSGSQTYWGGRPRSCGQSAALRYGRGRRRRATCGESEYIFYERRSSHLSHSSDSDDDYSDDCMGEEDEMDDAQDGAGYARTTRRKGKEPQMLNHLNKKKPVIAVLAEGGWQFDEEIFLPTWRRESYSSETSRASGPHVVQVDQIRLE